MELAETAEPKLHGPEQVAWLDRLEAEHDNMRAALAWSQSEPDGAETGLRIASSLAWFWQVRGYFQEGRRTVEAGLASAGGVPLGLRVKALSAAGQWANLHRDFVRAAQVLEESISLARTLGDEQSAARAQSTLGETARFQRDHARATALYEDSLARQRRVGDRWGAYHTLWRLAEVAREQGFYERSIDLHEQSLAMRRQAEDYRAIAGALDRLGLLAVAQHNPDYAASCFGQALQINRQCRNYVGTAICLDGLASVALALDQPRRAACLLGAVEALVQRYGGTLHWGPPGHFEADCAAARAKLDEPSFLAAYATGSAMTLDEAIAYALSPD
jgi:tetratricopeptide (TPR) repeat protein